MGALGNQCLRVWEEGAGPGHGRRDATVGAAEKSPEVRARGALGRLFGEEERVSAGVSRRVNGAGAARGRSRSPGSRPRPAGLCPQGSLRGLAASCSGMSRLQPGAPPAVLVPQPPQRVGLSCKASKVMIMTRTGARQAAPGGTLSGRHV